VRWVIASVVVSLSLVPILGGSRQARACPPAVRLDGEKALVSEVAPVLAGRGISTAAGGCPALAVSIERRGRATLVWATADGDQAGARSVTDVRTAATVIESWVRTDVAEPLLARRPPADDPETPAVLVATPPAAPAARLRFATLGEVGLASDRTVTGGFALRACSMVGRVCVGGGARFATVVDGPTMWEATMDREAVDALADADLPMHLGPVTMSPGLGVGAGWVHTHEEDGSDAKQTAGLRGELRLALSVRLARQLALASVLSLELAQTLATEADSRERLPSDPRALAHVGLGLVFGGP
jgi:hypothetical protein